MSTEPDRLELVGKLAELQALRADFVSKRLHMNASIPALGATRAEREVYDERYNADEEAERALRNGAVAFAVWATEHDVAAALNTPIETNSRTGDTVGTEGTDAPLPLSQSITPPEVGEQRERERIVTWLRSESARIQALMADEIGMTDLRIGVQLKVDKLAESIARGEHTSDTPGVVDGTAGLVEALEPFKRGADNLDAYGSTKGDHEISHGMGIVTAGDLRRARTALVQHRGGK